MNPTESLPHEASGARTAPGDPLRPTFFYGLCRALSRIAAVGLYGLRARGAQNVPRRGGVILASNHASYLDPIMLSISLRRPVAFLARQTLFRGILGRVIRALNTFPVPRESLSPDSLKRAVELLRRGWPLVVFPEGTRSADGALAPLRRGVALLAERAGVPVVPARISGGFEAWPRHRRFPRPRGRISIAFGSLLVYDRRSDTYDRFTQTIGRALARLGEASPEPVPSRAGGGAPALPHEDRNRGTDGQASRDVRRLRRVRADRTAP